MQPYFKAQNNTKTAYTDPITSTVWKACNFGPLLSYISSYAIAYNLSPVLTEMVNIDTRIQLITPLPDSNNDIWLTLLKWGFTATTSLGFILIFVSTYPLLNSIQLTQSSMMFSFKILNACFLIQTFDTLFIFITKRFLITVKQINKIDQTNKRFEFVTCIREQFDAIQKGFGYYFLYQFGVLTFVFILFSYSFMTSLLYFGNSLFHMETCVYLTGTAIVMMTNLLKMSALAFAAEWMRDAVEHLKFRLMEYRELSNNSDTKVTKPA